MSRRMAREAAFMVLFAKEFGSADDYQSVLAMASDKARPKNQDEAFTTELVTGTLQNKNEIDAIIGRHAIDWQIANMPLVDLCILRIAIYELLFDTLPDSVCINEALELAKTYAGDKSAAFINGVLGGVSRQKASEGISSVIGLLNKEEQNDILQQAKEEDI